MQHLVDEGIAALLGRTRTHAEQVVIALAHGTAPSKVVAVQRTKHAASPMRTRHCAPSRHADAPWRVPLPPMGRQGFQAAMCRDLLSCLSPLPFAVAPGVGGPAALLAASAPANAPMAAGRARSRQNACTCDGCAGRCAKRGADAPALHTRRHGGSSRNGMPDGSMRCTATCSESAAIMNMSPARPDARRRSRRMR